MKYLLSLPAIRDRAGVVWEAAQTGDLTHFDFHPERLDDVADFVTSVIKVGWEPRVSCERPLLTVTYL